MQRHNRVGRSPGLGAYWSIISLATSDAIASLLIGIVFEVA
jgi:hypothetical protein